MGKIIRTAVAILLVVTALILAVLPSGDASAATSTHGDFEFDGNTIVKYLGNSADVTIPNWVTTIGAEAFANNTSIHKIVLPDSVRTIDYNAFLNCSNLEIVKMPESVKTIGSSAFSGCTNLYSVSIPAKTNSIGSGAFAGCTSLATVPIDEENVNYICQDGVIYTKDGSTLVQYLAGRPYTSYEMPLSVTKIGEYAFWGAPNLQKVSISTGVDAIPEYAFANCNGMQYITLPNSVERINAFSFADCSNLLAVTIPDSVGYIDERAFYMSNGTIVRFVDGNGNVIKLVDAENADEYINGENVPDASEERLTAATSQVEPSEDEGYISSNTYNGSFSGSTPWVTEIENKDYMANVGPGELASSKIIGGSALVMLPSETEVYDGYNINKAEYEDGFNYNNNILDNEEAILNDTYIKYSGSAKNITVPEGISTIGERAFYGNENLANVILPSTLTNIEDFAFSRTPINSISIPQGTTDVGYGAFYGCNQLVDVSIPNTVSNIELGAFDDCAYILNWKISDDPNDFLIVGDNVLLAYKGDSDIIIIPEGVKHIAAGAFSNNNTLEKVALPSSVQDIGEDCFNGCSNLSEVTFKNGIRSIDDRAFKNTAISVVYLPDSLESIGLGAFDTSGNNNPLKTVIIAGKDIPNVSYCDTATRLSSENLRTNALEGVENVIIENDCDIDSGTLLNPYYLGFKGQVYTINNNDNPNTLTLERALTRPDAAGTVTIDSHVPIGDERYIMDNVKQHAFDFYKEWGKWCDTKPSSVNVAGNSSNELNSLLNSINSDISSTGNMNSYGVTINLLDNIFPENSMIYANIPDYMSPLLLNISSDSANRDKVNEAFRECLGGIPDASSVYLNLELFDKSGSIPVHKLGSNKMEVSLPIPSGFTTNDSIGVGALLDNGVLENLSVDIRDNNINFVTDHCSSYIIYKRHLYLGDNIGGLNVQDNNDAAVNLEGNIDGYMIDSSDNIPADVVINNSQANSESVFKTGIINTLNRQINGEFQVKWLIILILLSLAGILALYKPSAKSKK